MPKIQTILPNLCISAVLLLSTAPAKAQITPDNTLGVERSVITPNTPVRGANGDLITGGAQRGRNLFHSFSDFNVSDGQRVYFANPSDVTNILTRVTGGNRSNILGTLGVDGTANLFLINPAGIFFGKNATLDLRGSFVGTTANGVQFGNLGSFSATNPQAPPLLTIDPSGLLFNQLHQGATITNQSIAGANATGLQVLGATITNQSIAGANATGLQVLDGKSLLLVGGDVVLDGGGLTASGGRVELASLAAPGTIGLNVAGDKLSLSLPSNVQRGNVSLKNQAFVDVRSGGGGDIAVNAGNLTMSNSYLEAGIGAVLGNGNSTFGIFNNNTVTVLSNGSSKAGDININADSVSLSNGAQIYNNTYGQGSAGNVIINATKSVSLDGSYTSSNGSLFSNGSFFSIFSNGSFFSNGTFLPSGIFSTVGVVNDSNTSVKGNGGNIQIITDQLSLTNGAQLLASTYAQGNAGNVIINATKNVSLDNSTIFSTVGAVNNVDNIFARGNGGSIQITTDQLSLTNGAQLLASTYGQGNAGNVNINAAKNVSLNGSRSDIFSSVGSFNNNQNSAGSIIISGAGSGEFSTTSSGSAGSIIIPGGSGEVSSTSSGSTSSASGTISSGGGSGFISTRGVSTSSGSTSSASVTISSGGGSGELSISSGNLNFLAVGNGGSINITTESLSLANGAELKTDTYGIGNAGNVSIKARDAVILTGVNNGSNSGIFSAIQSTGIGKGGSIQIATDQLSLSNGAELVVGNYGQGNAGNVIINATRGVSLDGTGTAVFSSVGAVNNSENNLVKGNSGNIQITTDQLSLSNGAELVAGTYGQGNAGNVIINATRGVSLDGTGTAVFSSVGAVNNRQNNFAVGNGGRIQINTDQLSVTNSAQVSASSFGKGNAGNLTLTANSLNLDKGQLTAQSVSGLGGNISITVNDILLMRHNSLISNTSGTTQSPGKEGELTINTKFLIAAPLENNDIITNAFSGSGGKINITATGGLFGFEVLSGSQTLEPPTNDIIAISNSTTPNIDPGDKTNITSGLVAPPIQLSDATTKFSQLCPNTPNPKKKPLGSFTITGRGSIPPNPLELLPGRNPDIPLANAEDMQEIKNIQAAEQRRKEAQQNKSKKTNEIPSIVEAQGIVQTPDGQIYFVANAHHATPSSQPTASPCPSQN